MRGLLLFCASLLFLSTMNLPIGYYTLLRIVIFIGAVIVIATEYNDGLSPWLIAFGLAGIIFNPIFPIYFNDKGVWIPIDIAFGILFTLKSIVLTYKKNKT